MILIDSAESLKGEADGLTAVRLLQAVHAGGDRGGDR